MLEIREISRFVRVQSATVASVKALIINFDITYYWNFY